MLQDDLATFAKSPNSVTIDTLIARVTTQLERQPETITASAAATACRNEGDVESSSEKVISTADLLTLLQAINSFVSTEPAVLSQEFS